MKQGSTYSPASTDVEAALRTVFLARHGETDWNRERRWQGQTDIPLNDEGRRQAEALAARLAPFQIRAVHASDLSRASETARIVAGCLGLAAVVTDPDLRERNFGVFEGLTASECERMHPEMWRRYRADRTRPEGAEPEGELLARLRRGIERAARSAEVAVVVSHGGALRAFLRDAGLDPLQTDDFAFANGSAVCLELEVTTSGGCTIRSLRSTL